MPIHKAEILGFTIDINYEESEKEKLLMLINRLEQRLIKFPESLRINKKAIIFLTALKIEDELVENKKLLINNEIYKKKLNEKSEIILKLNEEVVILQNKFDKLSSNSSINAQNDSLVLEKIKNLENLIETIQVKIKNELE